MNVFLLLTLFVSSGLCYNGFLFRIPNSDRSRCAWVSSGFLAFGATSGNNCFTPDTVLNMTRYGALYTAKGERLLMGKSSSYGNYITTDGTLFASNTFSIPFFSSAGTSQLLYASANSIQYPLMMSGGAICANCSSTYSSYLRIDNAEWWDIRIY
jgi:hypothetical protein